MPKVTLPWASVSSTTQGWLPGQPRQALHGPISPDATSCSYQMITAAASCKHISISGASTNVSANSGYPSLQVAGARKVLILDWDVHHGEPNDLANLGHHPSCK